MDGAPGGGPPPPPPPLGRPDNGRGGPPAAENQQNGDVPDQNGNGGSSRPLGPQPAAQQGPQPQMIGPQPQQQIGPQQEVLDPAEAERRQHAKLWDGVAHNLKANSNVVWVKAVDSLELARKCLLADPPSPEARRFVDDHTFQIVNILLDQRPNLGDMERDCVDKSLRCALAIIKDDLERCADANAEGTGGGEGGEGKEHDANSPAVSPTLNVLGSIFCKNKSLYRHVQWGRSGNQNETRGHLILAFRRMRGMQALGRYLGDRAGTTSFPSMEIAKEILGAAVELIPASSGGSTSGGNGQGETDSQASKRAALRAEVRSLAKAVMEHLLLLDERSLKTMNVETIKQSRRFLHRIHNKLADVNNGGGVEAYGSFYEWTRALALKLITSQSLPLKLFGWDTVGDIIGESSRLAPAPRAFKVSGAGSSFADGLYEFDAKRMTSRGYAKSGVEPQYHLTLPPNMVDAEGNPVPAAGKTLTLFRCTMRSQHKWWFLSIPDPDQPGTDKDVDYYQHKSTKEQEAVPSASGWLTCKAGADPPPRLEAVGKLVPEGEEENTLEHQLARWAIENEVIEKEVLGDGTHREVVSRSGGLIQFLAKMCNDTSAAGGDATASMDDGRNKYCLQASHLLLAWRTCTDGADAAVSAQVQRLLVSILPSLSASLAVPLIECVRGSLETATVGQSPQPGGIPPSSSNLSLSGEGKGGSVGRSDHFMEVSEFCRVIAETMPTNGGDKGKSKAEESEGQSAVREAILSLQWAVLSHPRSRYLKSYESIKNYVASEIQGTDAVTGRLRNRFLSDCRAMIAKNASLTGGASTGGDAIVDENHALHAVQLAKFLMEGYPREEMEALVAFDPTEKEAHLPTLLYRELLSYMERRGRMATMPPIRKPSSTSIAPEFNHAQALAARLQILRFVYGLTPTKPVYLDSAGAAPSDADVGNVTKLSPAQLEGTKLSTDHLSRLWKLCVSPPDREAIMTFLANSSRADGGKPALREENAMHKIDRLHAAFVDNAYVFEHLFCAADGLGWEHLGEVAFASFQSFDAGSARGSERTTDALWNISLTSGNDAVAGRAMNDLLSVYNAPASPVSGSVATADGEGAKPKSSNQFSQRIFACLVQVKEGLQKGERSSERKAERCIRILSAAIEQCNSLGGSASMVAKRLASLQQSGGKDVEAYLDLVPHGMRGLFSCESVSIVARIMPRQGDGEKGGNASLKTQPERFSIQVHPLQTLASIRRCIAQHCNHEEEKIKLTGMTGRRAVSRGGNGAIGPAPTGAGWNSSSNDPSRAHLATLPDHTLAADVGITEGSEIIALLSDKPTNNTNNDNAAATTNGGIVNLIPGEAKEQPKEEPAQPKAPSSLDLTSLFSQNGPGGSSDLFFDTLISVLESLPPATVVRVEDSSGTQGVGTEKGRADTHSLVWDLLLAMPTNSGVIANVHAAAGKSANSAKDGMAVEPISVDWGSLLDSHHFERSVYVMQILDSFLRPAPVIFSCLEADATQALSSRMSMVSANFRTAFIESGGFEAVLKLFIESGKGASKTNKMGNEFALRIIKRGFFTTSDTGEEVSEEGRRMINSFATSSACASFLRSLVAVVIEDNSASDDAIMRVLQLTRMMLESGGASVTTSFTSLPDNAAERFLTSLLLWKSSTDSPGGITASGVRSSKRIRTGTEEMILAVPTVSASAIPWLIESLEGIDPATDGSDEFFSVLLKLVLASSTNMAENASLLRQLGMAVCVKLAAYPRPDGDTAASNDEHSTGILCGCLKLLIALVKANGSHQEGLLVEGSQHILQSLSISPWSGEVLRSDLSANDKSLLDLMGLVFDGFLSGVPSICSDEESRRLAFQVICAAAQTCHGGLGYGILSSKINGIISNVAPTLRHRWGQNISVDDGQTLSSRNANKSVKYSGLKNQGCTCYMNSVLQQLFMMPALREKICSAELPTLIRSAGVAAAATGKGGESLVGKKIRVHWENGNKYDAVVEGYNEKTGMHRINYCMVHLAGQVGRHPHQQQQATDVSSLPRDLPEEYILSEGRPGKETGAFEIATDGPVEEGKESDSQESSYSIKETPDEAASRLLLEEVQRTFVNLSSAAKSRNCYDPRSLVEASHCLKLEFDVWQQNDASEFATKLLDRLEISLKKWSPVHFRYLGHTFGMKKVVQKICRECGLKSNREEDLMNIDCQIRNISSIDEALSGMCEDEVMEGDNKVTCDQCKVKTNTVLRTAISALPDVLVLSLKRFDLDYTTFETVKLNNRCEFGESLNMKQYTLQAKEILEAAEANASNARDGNGEMEESKSETGSMEEGSLMDVEGPETKDGPTPGQGGNEEDEFDPLSVLPDEDYEYRLAGVLVHAGVAQGGHYYSFIKERGAFSSTPSAIPKSASHGTNLGASSHTTTSSRGAFAPPGDKWYRFDDEDVTPFDPSSIEQECFGGTVKKETKYPNGHVDSRTHDRIANALMLFYEKVKPLEFDDSKEEDKAPPANAVASVDAANGDTTMEEDSKQEESTVPSDLPRSNGYDVFLPEVKKSNSTHSLQSFLLKEEFRAFVKELLDLCSTEKKSKQDQDGAQGDSMDVTPTASPTSADDSGSAQWRTDIIRTALSFLFDVLFHLSLERKPLEEWSKSLADIFSSSPDITSMFVGDLARRTRSVCDNWIRAYTMECPEEGSRRTAVQIFASAITSLLHKPSEQTLLQNWTACWSSQAAEYEQLIRQQKTTGAMPTRLEAPNARPLEEVANVGATASSVGIVLSFLSELIEVSLRYTQGNIDLCLFVRELARVGADTGDGGAPPNSSEGKLLRDAMVAAQFIPRLTSLETRGNTHNILRHLFPGSSASPDVIEAISRNESHPTNIMQMGMNNNSGDSNRQNLTHLLEAIGCLLGVAWIIEEPTSYETGDRNHGRAVRALTPLAIKCLTEVFEESKPEGSAGMTARDVHGYLQKCGHRVEPQRIQQIFERHAVEEETDGSKRHVLNLKGFLAYYTESVHTHEYQVQHELETAFGYRPNLTRRPDNSRFYTTNDESGKSHNRSYRITEGIALDVGMHSNSLSRVNWLADTGLHNLHFVHSAWNADKIVGEYLLAASAITRDTTAPLMECIGFLHQNIHLWQPGSNNGDGIPLVLMVMQVLAAIPDEGQSERISTLMMNEDTDLHRTGLVVHTDRVLQDRRTYDTQNRAKRYYDLIESMRKQIHIVDVWVSTNRSHLPSWMDPEDSSSGSQSRSDRHSGRRGHHQQMSHTQDHTDDMEDSDLDDDDDDFSRSSDRVDYMVVQGAGAAEINGVYKRVGRCDGVPKYTKPERYQGRDEEFCLYRCKLTDGTQRWYLSIVPMGTNPGSTKDIDFYAAAPERREVFDLPPKDHWIAIPNRGTMPAPVVYPHDAPYGEVGDEYDDGDHRGRPRGVNLVADNDSHGYL